MKTGYLRAPVGNVNSIEMPRYTCHKQVWALKIGALLAPSPHIADGWLLVPTNTRYQPIRVEDAWLRRHRPEHGGYFVVYDDGYKSYSPAKAFEDGYTLIAAAPNASEKTGTKCAKCGYVRTVWAVCPSGCDTSMGQFLNDINEGLRRLRESAESIAPDTRNHDAQGRVLSGCAVRAAIQDEESLANVASENSLNLELMQRIQRYTPVRESEGSNCPTCEPDETGDFVRYDEHVAMLEGAMGKPSPARYLNPIGNGPVNYDELTPRQVLVRVGASVGKTPLADAPLEEGETVKGEALFKDDATEPGTMEFLNSPPDLAVNITTDTNVLTKMREGVAAIEDQPADIIIDTSNDPVPRDEDRDVRVGRWLEVLGTSLRSRRSPVHCRVETDTSGAVPVAVMTVTLRPEARLGAWGDQNPIPYHLFGPQA